MPQFSLDAYDLASVGLYLVAILWIGFRVSKKTSTTEDYFLAGRSLTWPLIGFSLFASNISSSTLIGLAGDAYGTGIAVYNYEWFAVVVLVFFIIVFLPFYLRYRIYTMPEFLEHRFDARSRYYMSGITILGNILLETAGGLYAGAIVVQLVYPEIPLWQIVSVLALVAGAYTVLGGLKAVVYTDAIQAVLLLIGSTTIAVIAYMKVGSWDAVTAVTPPKMLSLIQPIDDPALPWLGLVTGLPLLGIYFWCNNQFMVQRTLGSKSLDHGRWGALFAGLLKVPVIFIMVLPGTFARVLYPDLGNADQVFPTLIFDLLPIGFRGIVLMALLAAIMSSIDSTLNAVSTLVTMDFAKKWRPNYSNAQLVRFGRVATIVVMVLAALWAPQIVQFPSLWQYLQGVLAYISPPIVACFVIGIFWSRANATGAFSALLSGLVLAIVLMIAGMPFHFLYVAAILFVVCSLVLVLVSLATDPPAPEKTQFVWTREEYRKDTIALRDVAWYKNYRILSGLLLALTFAVVGFFF